MQDTRAAQPSLGQRLCALGEHTHAFVGRSAHSSARTSYAPVCATCCCVIWKGRSSFCLQHKHSLMAGGCALSIMAVPEGRASNRSACSAVGRCACGLSDAEQISRNGELGHSLVS